MSAKQTETVAPSASDVQFSEEESGGRFFIDRKGKRVAELTFARKDTNKAVLDHSFVAPELRGQGVARLLLDATVDWARRTHTKVIPHCSYADAEFKRDPSIGDVLA